MEWHVSGRTMALTRVVALGELNREQCASITRSAVLVLPLGATEQHGPHLSTSTDSVLVTAIARAGAERAAAPDAVVLAPTLAFGSSDHHLPFGATLSLGNETFIAAVHDLLSSAVACGFRAVLALNGHGGNAAAMRCAVERLVERPGSTVACASYWECVDEHDLPEIEGRFPGHAGVFETSAMLAAAPGLVSPSSMRPPPRTPPRTPRGMYTAVPGSWQLIDGFSDDPAPSTRETGETVIATLAEAVGRRIDDLWVLAAGSREAAS